VRRVRETRDTVTLTIDDEAGRAFSPGQFTMMLVPGNYEVAISISGNPARGRLVQTIRAVGAPTRAVTLLQPGDVVGIRGPFGTCWPLQEAVGSDVVIVAGGIGLAPLRPAVYQVLANRARYGRVMLLYGARTPGDLLYRSELARWRGRLDLDVGVTVDVAAPDWRGDVGVVTRLIARGGFDPSSTVALLCGPEVMMRFAAAALLDSGLSPEDVWVSMERNMICGVGLCGHCQLGPLLICRDGPIMRLDSVAPLWSVREL
jgi:NAD(P)H-flavin reductase